MLSLPVLLLNQNYQPLNICDVRRAIVLLDRGKAELLLNGRGEVHTTLRTIAVPSVIRLAYMVRRPVLQRRLSRREVFIRDGYTCQYCGKETRELTLDHVVPRHSGGPHAWDNVVAACIPCNHRKAGHTLQQVNMRPAREPSVPRPDPYALFHHRPVAEEWRTFVPWLS